MNITAYCYPLKFHVGFNFSIASYTETDTGQSVMCAFYECQ